MRVDVPIELDLAGLRVNAQSVAGRATCIELPELKLCFDIGVCSDRAAGRCRTVLSTHGHVDHLGALPHHVARRAMWHLPPTRLVVEHGEVPRVEALLAAWRGVARSELPCEVVAMRVGERLELGGGLTARAFRSSHRAPTLGYGLYRSRERLKPALRALPGAEIGRLRQSGVPVTEAVDELAVAFTGDTRAVVLAREPWLLEARLLIIECTFLDDDGALERADRTGHVALARLAEQLEGLGSESRVLLTHFSARYAPDEVRAALDRCLPAAVRDRVAPLLPVRPG